MAAYRQHRRDLRYYRAVARQLVMLDRGWPHYITPAPVDEFLRREHLGRVDAVDWVSYLPGARDIHDLIDAWHDEPGDKRPLHEYLGLTEEQYAAWVAGHGLPPAALLYDSVRPAIDLQGARP